MENIKLESLLVCLDTHLTREDIQFDQVLGYESPKFIDANTLSMKYQNPFVRVSEVPLVFQKRASINQDYERFIKKFGLRLFYCFNDETIIEWNELLHHPYAEKMHPDQLPLLKGVYDSNVELSDYRWVREEHRLGMHFGDMEHVFLRVVKNAQILVANRRLRLLIMNKKSREDIQSVQFVRFDSNLSLTREEKIKISFDCVQAEGKNLFKTDIDTGGLELFKNFYIDSENNVLVFHKLSGFFNEIEAFLSKEMYSDKDISNHSIRIPANLLNFDINSPDIALILMNLFRTKLAEKYHVKTDFNHESIVIEKSHYERNIYFSKKGDFGLSVKFDFEDQAYEVFNFDAFLKELSMGFEKGTKTFLKRMGWPHSFNTIKRTRDQKFLKHLGLYHYIVFECLSHILNEKASDGKAYDEEEFFEFFFNNLSNYFFSGDGNTLNESLDQIVSSKLMDQLEHFYHYLKSYKNSDHHLLIGGKELIIKSLKENYLKLYYEMLQAIVIASGGDCFVRTRTNYFPLFVGLSEQDGEEVVVTDYMWRLSTLTEKNPSLVDRYSLVSKGLKRPLNISEFFGVIDDGWNVFVDGMDVQLLEEGDFNWKFELNEGQEKEVDPTLAGKQKIDWFELHPKFFLHGNEIDFESARKLSQGQWIEFNNKFFVLKAKELPSVKILEKFWNRISNKAVAQSTKNSEKPYFQLDRHMTLELLALRTLGVEIEGGERWESISQFYDQLGDGTREPKKSNTLNAELKTYQDHGLRWLQDLYELGLGGILADDMGLGKTIQALSFLDRLRETDTLGKSLILVPTSLVYNWMSESKKFTPKLRMLNFQSKEKEITENILNSDEQIVVIATYGLFTEHEEFFQQYNWNIHIYDEAQNLKNIVTKRTTAARKANAKFKLCLTGTPLENHLGEFYSLLDLCVPGSLGPYEEFKKLYVNPYSIEPSDMKFLKLKSRPLVLRRTKSEILKELPEKRVTVLKIPFSEKQMKVYRDVALSWNEKVKESIKEVGEAKSQMIMLTALLRLRQVCSDPDALPGVSFTESPPKVELLKDTVNSIVEAGESAIIFTQFITSLERIKSVLAKEGVKVFSIDGRSSKAKREETLRGFSEYEGGCVLAMTLKTGGVGLNLTKASYVFHLEPWWNPAVEDQATDRVHRLGQNRSVQVYRYIMEESVEEKIEKLKERKASYFKSLFDVEDNEPLEIGKFKGLTQEDFEYLLS
ncbi:MAG: DEAD/DEAH box helicase [Bdellovibrionales bacterium]